MKIRMIQILAIGAVIVSGAALLSGRNDAEPAVEPQLPPEPVKEMPKPEKPAAGTVRKSVQTTPTPPASNVAQQATAKPKPVKKRARVSRKPPRPTLEQRRAAMLKYWQRAEDQFNRQWDKLERTGDPAVRDRLIDRMAQYVRMNTLDTIDWAMGLEDPGERRQALEAINKYALSGIGARIAVDDTGFPKIQETTVLSAVESTGMVEPGDYIVGMVNTEGQAVDFKGMPMHQIIQHLRGEPGSDVLLLMERAPSDESMDSYPYDVPVQRSLLVIQPPN